MEKLENVSIVRSAFIIDEVKYKISKSQRKFAILTISDGEERYELPVWPELYAQKSSLLQENQLVYAILQIERNDNTIKLQCKWLEDLANVDDKLIKQYDDTYDKLKESIHTEDFRKKRNGFVKRGENFINSLKIRINAEKFRFTKVLELKEIFKANPGKTKVELEFYLENNKIAHLEIDSALSVNYKEELKSKILSLQGIVDVLSN